MATDRAIGCHGLFFTKGHGNENVIKVLSRTIEIALKVFCLFIPNLII